MKRLVPSARNAELQAAVIADPLEPAARMVYSDWLQSTGHPLGEWTALATAIEADATNLQLRAMGVDYLDRNQAQILGKGAPLLRGGWLGWRGGFIDEIRLQAPAKTVAAKLAALLAQPCCRFVRYIAIGELPKLDSIIATIVHAAPPLLEGLLVTDKAGPYWGNAAVAKPIDAIADIATLRSLALRGVGLGVAMPQLRTLSIASPVVKSSPAIAWLLANKCPNLEELFIDCSNPAPIANTLHDVLTVLPKLRRFRLIRASHADGIVDTLLPQLSRLELVELSVSDVHPERIEKLAAAGVKVVALEPAELGETAHRPDDAKWIVHQLRESGRDTLRMHPGAGLALYNTSTRAADDDALVLLEASLTLPDQTIGTYAYANLAGVYGRSLRFDES